MRMDATPSTQSHVYQPYKVQQSTTIEHDGEFNAENEVEVEVEVRSDDVCRLRNTTHRIVLDRVKLYMEREREKERREGEREREKIFCGVYTMGTRHGGTVKDIRDTWGKRCDKWISFSTTNDFSLPAVYIPHEGEESYQNMYNKIRAIWKYIYVHYYHSSQYDWFLLGGDDLYVIIENLRTYLRSDEIKRKRERGEGVYLGRRVYRKVMRLPHFVYNTGESGYILDRVALHHLIRYIDNRVCRAHEKVSWEDVHIGLCLLTIANITVINTAEKSERETEDKRERERERFHYSTPGNMRNNPIPERYFADERERERNNGVLGDDCCAYSSISFHHIQDDLMRGIDDYLYKCPLSLSSSVSSSPSSSLSLSSSLFLERNRDREKGDEDENREREKEEERERKRKVTDVIVLDTDSII